MYNRIIIIISYLRCTNGSFSLSLISDVQTDHSQYLLSEMYIRIIIIIISYLRCTTGSTTSWWGCWSAHASATWSTSKARCSTRTETMTSAQHHHDHFHHIYHHLHIIVIIIISIFSSFYDRGLESRKQLCQIIDLVILSSQSRLFSVLCFVPVI